MEFQLASWTIEEYITAVQHDAFFDHVKRLFAPSDAPWEKRVELVKAKYFAAGGSARLMFGSTTDVAIKSFNFAARAMASTKDLQLVLRFHQAYDVNPSTHGQLLAVWLFAELTHNGVNYSIYEDSTLTQRKWDRSRRSTPFFDPDEEALAIPFDHPTWFAPVKWAQEGSDAVFASKELSLVRFVQLFGSKDPMFDPRHFRALLQRLVKGGDLKEVYVVALYFLVQIADDKPCGVNYIHCLC